MTDDFSERIKSSDRRTQLEAMRDKITHELTVHKCKTCEANQMRMSDLAALIRQLQKILEDLDAIPEKGEEKTEVEKIRESLANKVASGGASNVVEFPFGTKSSPRRQGGRRPPVKGDS